MPTDGVLTRTAFGWTTPENFTSLCPNGSKWVWEGLGECAQDARDMASVYLGLLSILCFMVSSFPQYYNSCKTGNMDRALSIWFLLLWLAGDSCNLIGSFLADQLPLQKYTAIYYVIADLVMLTMYTYYKMKRKAFESENLCYRWRTGLHVVGVFCILCFVTTSTSAPLFLQPFTTKEIIGFCIGSLSSVLYLFSRLPQIYTNFKRKSTAGVSYFLFALVILGNTTYGLSVLLKNPDLGQGESSYLIHHLPWLIGSLGTLTLDLIISVQFMIYRNAQPRVELNHDETAPLIGS
uniref:Lysosomal amino acid transporter 1 homolog n=1 Tax=Amphilophus citrinellus TaxID=61819 RepID=A0A3Q0S6Z3_AMPCI